VRNSLKAVVAADRNPGSNKSEMHEDRGKGRTCPVLASSSPTTKM